MSFRLTALALAFIGVPACQEVVDDGAIEVQETGEATLISSRVEIAEQMIDAFYSFDADRLRPFLTDAGDTAQRLMFYQGWAEGGNYKIISRAPCAAEPDDKVVCPITVEDDAVMALKTDFKVTDTFTLSFDGDAIASVETSSNDKPVYYEASAWVRENFPEIMEGPCKGFFADGPTPGDCARAMSEGYKKFAESDDFPG